jgi:glycogen debranching enzyme
VLVALRPAGNDIHLHANRLVLSTGLDGFIRPGGEQGLYDHEARVLSELRYRIDDTDVRAAGASAVTSRHFVGYYLAYPPGRANAPDDRGSGLLIPDTQQTLELIVRRTFASAPGSDSARPAPTDWIEERLTLCNYSDASSAFRLHVHLAADFLGLPEVRFGPQGLGTVERRWESATKSLIFEWRAHTGADHREIRVAVDASDSPPASTELGLSFPVELAPGHTWSAQISLRPSLLTDVERLQFREPSSTAGPPGDPPGSTTQFDVPDQQARSVLVVRALERAREDLEDLRLADLDQGPHAWTMAAGVPLYSALFGRDTLTASWQAAMITPDMMRGTLQVLAALQGRRHDDWRDEAPGRFIHEAHTGPLEVLGVNPRARYYGSVTTSGFFPVVLAQYWHWTGDEELVRALVPHALDGLRWLDEEGDRDGDGFVEYLTRSSDGVKHQGWKDSGDAIVYPDGSAVEPPIATCEEQAFVYTAKLLMVELLWRLGDRPRARRLLREARRLRRRFEEAFWMPSEGFLAMALDAEKRQVASIGSNAGHCLAAGLVRRDRVQTVADRLFAPDLFSGWGIRTLSSTHPAFNPHSYHRGTVWPVEQGSFALGLARYGLHDHLDRLAAAVFDATAIFEHGRLPELFSGHSRDDEHPFPALYPQANAPQAWSASTLFLIVQSLLGLYPYAPSNLLFVDPRLPEWLPALAIRDLQVGDATISLEFRRRASGATAYEVTDKRGTLHIVQQASPWSLTESVARRIRTLLGSALKP